MGRNAKSSKHTHTKCDCRQWQPKARTNHSVYSSCCLWRFVRHFIVCDTQRHANTEFFVFVHRSFPSCYEIAFYIFSYWCSTCAHARAIPNQRIWISINATISLSVDFGQNCVIHWLGHGHGHRHISRHQLMFVARQTSFQYSTQRNRINRVAAVRVSTVIFIKLALCLFTYSFKCRADETSNYTDFQEFCNRHEANKLLRNITHGPAIHCFKAFQLF